MSKIIEFKKNISYCKIKLLPITVDVIQFYISKKITLHPYLYDEYINKLIYLSNQNKISLTPELIFEIFNTKFKKILTKK